MAAAALEKGSSDLRFLFDRAEVPVELQVKIFEAEITNIRTFGALVGDAAELKELAKKEFDLDYTASLKHRVVMAKLVSAWETAKNRAAKLDENEQERELLNQPKLLPGDSYHTMRNAFEAKYWKLDDRQVPAKSYVEKVLDRVEKNDLKAEPLTEVLNLDDNEDESLKPAWDAAGRLQAIKVDTKLALPSGTEELRARVTLLGTAWLFAAFANPHREYLKGLSPQVFQDYLSYLLGEYVYGLKSAAVAGASPVYPSWELILTYEHELRKKALKLIRTGARLAEALATACADSVTKERNFTTPLQIAPKRAAPSDLQEPPKKLLKGQSEKGNGKGKAKGKGTRGRAAPSANTRPHVGTKLLPVQSD